MSVVIVNHNGAGMVGEAVAALQQHTSCDRAEVIVVDSGSRDGSADGLPAGPLPVRVLRFSDNVGFCAGNNAGVSSAHGRLIVFAQPDGEVRPGWDQGLRAALDDPGVSVAGGVVLKRGSGERIDSAGLAIGPNFAAWGLHENLTLGEAGLRSGEHREVTGVSPAFLMVRRADHLAIGGFWEQLWMFGDEADYAVRMRRRGRAVLCPESIMIHQVGGSAGPYQSPLRLYYSARNRMLNAARHLPPFRFGQAVALTLAFDTLQMLQLRHRQAVAAVLRGWVSGLGGMPAARRLGSRQERSMAVGCLSSFRDALRQLRSLARASIRGGAECSE
jgi:N-acetylglucosaminyl-diphospho-decaprenol L-rhamnosyltransferase